MKRILGIISICIGIIGGFIIALRGRVPDAMAGATVFILLGIYLYKGEKSKK
ncbi:hypothetical protein LI177_13965 [bacterium 210820-DFI.6.37]|nr:hypothetical protein [bacterium 210820-DFI.6.37]